MQKHCTNGCARLGQAGRLGGCAGRAAAVCCSRAWTAAVSDATPSMAWRSDRMGSCACNGSCTPARQNRMQPQHALGLAMQEAARDRRAARLNARSSHWQWRRIPHAGAGGCMRLPCAHAAAPMRLLHGGGAACVPASARRGLGHDQAAAAAPCCAAQHRRTAPRQDL